MKKNILLSLAVLLLCACSTDPIKENKLTFEIDQKAVEKAERSVEYWQDRVDEYEAEYQEALKDKTKSKTATDLIKQNQKDVITQMEIAQKELEKTKNTLVGSKEMKIFDGIAVINTNSQTPAFSFDHYIEKLERKVLPMILANRDQFDKGIIIACAETLKNQDKEIYVLTIYLSQKQVEKLTEKSTNFLKWGEAINAKFQLAELIQSRDGSHNENVPDEYYNYLADYHE